MTEVNRNHLSLKGEQLSGQTVQNNWEKKSGKSAESVNSMCKAGGVRANWSDLKLALQMADSQIKEWLGECSAVSRWMRCSWSMPTLETHSTRKDARARKSIQ